jgi:hypothetical protein
VEVWSRFMKVAHQGQAIAGLPGVGRAALTAAAAPVTVGTAPRPGYPPEPGRPLPPERGGLDGWLVERLFGR